MDDKIFDQIQQVDLKKTMETSYIDYAMSVIASRALPDVPVQLFPFCLWVRILLEPVTRPRRRKLHIVQNNFKLFFAHIGTSRKLTTMS